MNKEGKNLVPGRLREEVDKGKMVPANQTRFRKGKETVDYIFVLNYLVNTQITTKRSKMVPLFVDLRAFYSVNREKLLRAVKERSVRGKSWW